MNKSLITNLLALAITLFGYMMEQPIIYYAGLFALSGAITNALAIHMLFEKVPGLYGSGVVPARFEDFKLGIRQLMMNQFFTQENIDRFLSDSNPSHPIDFSPIIQKTDLGPSFDKLIEVIMESSFAGMLGMFGGADALTPLKQPFIEKMQESLLQISQSDNFNQLIRNELESPNNLEQLRAKVAEIITARLDELTPQLVKQIVQDMIKKHLGWLVVWGGVFGGLIGIIHALLQS